MPELPDVEIFLKIIQSNCLNKPVVAVNVISQGGRKVRTLQNITASDFAAQLFGRTWTRVTRRGKFLIVELSDRASLIFHFMLAGWLEYVAPGRPAPEEVLNWGRLRFAFGDGASLYFADRRNLGKVFLVGDQDYSSVGVLARLGPEPLSPEFTPQAWRQIARKPRWQDSSIKDLLCEQSEIAGIGNIYSDLILWSAGVRPDRRVGTLSDREVGSIFDAVKPVLRHGIQELASGTISHNVLISQRRQGGTCPRCGKTIAAIRRGQAHSYFCPECQR